MPPDKKLSYLVWVIGVVGLFLTITAIMLCLFQKWGTEFASPLNSSYGVLFLEDQRLSLYALPDGKDPVFVVAFGLDSERQFAYAQWTADGKMFLCTLTNTSNSHIVVGYDFISDEKLVPEWFYLDKVNAIAEREFQSKIETRIAAHGGLSSKKIDRAMIRNALRKRIWHRLPPQKMSMTAKIRRGEGVLLCSLGVSVCMGQS